MNICIVGNGNIVKRFLEDVQNITDVHIRSLCVREASRSKGEALAEQYHIDRVETDYSGVLSDPSVDAVYIGIANHMHYTYAKQALEAGKHVICEKPFTVNLQQAQELASLAMEKNLFLWEASKLPYSRTYEILRKNLTAIGTPRIVTCNYSRKSSRYDEYQKGSIHAAFDPEKAGGSLYDINVYNLHLTTLLFGAPKDIHYYANSGPNGIDISGTAVLEYDGFHAVCTGAKDSTSPSGAILQGEHGYLRIQGPVSSASAVWLSQDGREYCLMEMKDSGRLTDEIRVFAEQYRTGDRAACYQALEHSLLVMKLLEQCRG